MKVKTYGSVLMNDLRWVLRRKWRPIGEWIRETYYRLFHTPVYAIIWSRDCDMFESTSARKFLSRGLYEKAREEDYQGWDEGPISYTEVTKEEYDEFEYYERDRVMEAYENGRGYSVIV